jgi:hypothetical protein
VISDIVATLSRHFAICPTLDQVTLSVKLNLSSTHDTSCVCYMCVCALLWLTGVHMLKLRVLYVCMCFAVTYRCAHRISAHERLIVTSHTPRRHFECLYTVSTQLLSSFVNNSAPATYNLTLGRSANLCTCLQGGNADAE